MSTDPYANIREILAPIIGQKVLDVSQHDKEEFESGSDSYFVLMFENGWTMRVNVTDSDKYRSGYPFMIEGPSEDDGDGLYHPSEEDLSVGKWATLKVMTVDGLVAHVIPIHGKLHSYNEGECWCSPSTERLLEENECRKMVVHNEEPEDGTSSTD